MSASIVGRWTLTTDWGCVGSPTGSFEIEFKADGTWSSTPFTHNGRWFQGEGLALWTFDDTANLIYSANVSGSWMAGIQGYTTGGGQGCFGGSKTALAARAAVAGIDAMTGPKS